MVDALKGTGYELSANNTLTTEQQALIAQTTFGNQVSIKTVAVNPITDNEVQLSFVDPDGKAVGPLKLTKGTNDKTALDTIKAAVKDDPTSSNSATVQKAYTELLTAAGIKGYTVAGLSDTQTKANLNAIKGATYGKDVKLTVAKIPVKALASSFTFFQHLSGWVTKDVPVNYFESSNGQRNSDTNFAKALAADSNLNGYAGNTVSVTSFNTALKDQHLDTIYYAAKNDGFLGAAKTHLAASDFGGSTDSIFAPAMAGTKIYIYKITITAKANDNTVALDNGQNIDTPLFDKNGNVTIGTTPVKVGLKYTQDGDDKKVTLDSTNFKAQSLAELYNK